MKLINHKGIEGYYYKDIIKCLHKVHRQPFKDFIAGQTVMLVPHKFLCFKYNKELVYQNDYKRFCFYISKNDIRFYS